MASDLSEIEEILKRDAVVSILSVADIRVLNPRARNQRIFSQLVENIAVIGLKRPITVALGGEVDGVPWYELLCGQGRFEALQALGESQIPCCIVEADKVSRYLITLTENIARRRHTTPELLGRITVLKERGYSVEQISKKTNLESSYLYGILHLMDNGEQRLIAAVEKGLIPITMAIDIAKSPSQDVQAALASAYEDGSLKGDRLMQVRRLVDRRQNLGKSFSRLKPKEAPTSHKLLRTYRMEVRRRKNIIQKANVHEQRLLLIVSAMKQILSDEHFRTLLRAEGVKDIPKAIADRIPAEILP